MSTHSQITFSSFCFSRSFPSHFRPGEKKVGAKKKIKSENWLISKAIGNGKKKKKMKYVEQFCNGSFRKAKGSSELLLRVRLLLAGRSHRNGPRARYEQKPGAVSYWQILRASTNHLAMQWVKSKIRFKQLC